MEAEGAGLPAFADPAEMYATVKPDAVVICTPHTLHHEHGMGALEAGCHVLMEKPMVTAAADAYEMKSKVEETGKVFVIGFNTACSPYFYYLREQIRSGAFGKLELVNGYLAQGWMKPTAGSWRQDPKLSGGGQAYDSGAHLFNSLCWSVESRVAERAKEFLSILSPRARDAVVIYKSKVPIFHHVGIEAELERLIRTLEEEMHDAAGDLRFEYAARLRDEVKELRRELRDMR